MRFIFCYLMIRRPPRSTRTYTLFPYTTLFRSYLMSNYMEILEFFGDYCDSDGNLETNRIITVVDRKTTVRNEQIPNWLGKAPINHVGGRFRQASLWAVGPLDNLVGLQYRIDHLDNAQADAFDLMIKLPHNIVGDVEEFD